MRPTLIMSGVLTALLLGAPVAIAQSQSSGTSGKFCLKGVAGASDCSFATMAACEQAKKDKGGECAPNASSTTGSAPSNSK